MGRSIGSKYSSIVWVFGVRKTSKVQAARSRVVFFYGEVHFTNKVKQKSSKTVNEGGRERETDRDRERERERFAITEVLIVFHIQVVSSFIPNRRCYALFPLILIFIYVSKVQGT